MGELKNLAFDVYAVRTFKLWFGTMHSVSAPRGLWKDGVCKAECLGSGPDGSWTVSLHPDKPAPQIDCDCGIYGALYLNHLTEQYMQYSQSVLTVIAAEGRTIMGTKGLRTERARVVAWWTPRMWATAVCTAQFVGAKRYTDMDTMVADFGIEKCYDPVPEPDYNNDPTDSNWWTA